MSSDEKKWSSRLVRGWYQPEPGPVPILPPLYQSCTYTYPTLDAFMEAGSRLALGGEAFFYHRLGNPTVSALEKRLAELENAERAVAVATGMAAISLALFSQLRAGDEVIAHERLYSASDALLHDYLPRLGFPTRMLDLTSPAKLQVALAERKARLVLIESPANPLVEVLDIAALAGIAHAAGALLVVDNTFASPLGQDTLKLGADLVAGSGTKYIGGHDDAMMGYLAGSKELLTSAENHALVFGPSLSAIAAWFMIRGLRTLPLRMERISASAAQVAAFLEAHHKVAKVHFPGLPSHPQFELAKKQMRLPAGMIAFWLKGDIEAVFSLLNHLSLIPVSVSLGDCATLIEHPATMTHAALDDERKQQLGVSDNLIRLSVGLEDPLDLIADLKAALEKV